MKIEKFEVGQTYYQASLIVLGGEAGHGDCFTTREEAEADGDRLMSDHDPDCAESKVREFRVLHVDEFGGIRAIGFSDRRATYRVVYKYHVEGEVFMPEGYKILHVGEQNRSLFVWALVDPNRLEMPVRFEVHGTGQPFDPEGLEHIGTAFQGPYVWHVFKRVA
jgi:hypothetical protein